MADQGEGTLIPDKPNQNDGATKKGPRNVINAYAFQFSAVQSGGLFYSVRILLNNSDSLVGVAIAVF